MNPVLKEAFNRIKPVCDMLMVCPTADTVSNFVNKITKLKKDVVQELQQYLLFPFITHISSTEIETKYGLQRKLVDGMRAVLERVTVNSFEMCMKIEIGLLQLVFDKDRPGMIAEIPEELKLSVMLSLTVLMLNMDKKFREKLMKTQVPLLAQAVFVAVHIAKLDRLRALRLAAIHCVTAHTGTHASQTDDYSIKDPVIEKAVVDMLSSILPGVLAGLQDVATCADNPGHGVIVAAIDAIHRILCITMHDKFLYKKSEYTADDFAKMYLEKTKDKVDTEVSSKKPKEITKRSPEWYTMAGDKLMLVTKSLIALRTHEHHKVRKELSVFCSRLLTECNTTMQPSIPLALDVLIALSKDEYSQVSDYCATAVSTYFSTAAKDAKNKTMDSLCENFFTTLTCLPRVLNNVDSARKLSTLNLLHGYIQVLGSEPPPQRVVSALSVHTNMQCLCNALLEAAALDADLTLLSTVATRDVLAGAVTDSPWVRPRCVPAGGLRRVAACVRGLAATRAADLLADRLMQVALQHKLPDAFLLLNWIGSEPKAPTSLIERILNLYIQEDMWYLPLEVGGGEAPLTSADTLDVSVYDPRAWHRDSVPGLYEGATETRYTDISYRTPRAAPPPRTTLREAQRNMLVSCLLTEGVGMFALTLHEHYQPYLMKVLCLVLERISNPYELLHQAGLKAVGSITAAAGHAGPADLIRCNADYLTNQITRRLKKAWDCESALQILSVVMEYSDVTMLDYMYGIVEDVLVQSCDKYYDRNLESYLQVFITFIECLQKWFKDEDTTDSKPPERGLDLLEDVREYCRNQQEAERLLDEEEPPGGDQSAEEMYREDRAAELDDAADYGDAVTKEEAPVARHLSVTAAIVRRCVRGAAGARGAAAALRAAGGGLRVLRGSALLLPLVHAAWPPLVHRFEEGDPIIMRWAIELLVTMASVSKDFIRARAIKEVLPHIYRFLKKSSRDSYLKDAGSSYRLSLAFALQLCSLRALPRLAPELALAREPLEDAMHSVDPYLSKKQPKPLQAAAVKFYETVLEYDYGAAWHHLRRLCRNDAVLRPRDPSLAPVVGTPFQPKNKNYENNIKLIFNFEVS